MTLMHILQYYKLFFDEKGNLDKVLDKMNNGTTHTFTQSFYYYFGIFLHFRTFVNL